MLDNPRPSDDLDPQPLPPDLPCDADSLNAPALPPEAEIPWVELTAVPKSQPVRATLIAPPPSLPVARRKPRPVKLELAPSFGSIRPLLIALIAYACMMAVSFGQATFAVLHAHDLNLFTDAQHRQHLVYDGLIFEGLDTLIVLSALLLAGRPMAPSRAAWPTA